MIRDITGVGDGHGAMMSIHDGFAGLGNWAGFMEGADRMVLDTHPYIAFNGQPNTQPIDFWPPQACVGWGPTMNERFATLFSFVFPVVYFLCTAKLPSVQLTLANGAMASTTAACAYLCIERS